MPAKTAIIPDFMLSARVESSQVQQSSAHLSRAFDKESINFAAIEGDRRQVIELLQTPTKLIEACI